MVIPIVFVSHTCELNGAELMLLELGAQLDKEKFFKILVVPQEGPLLREAHQAGFVPKIIHQKWWLTSRKEKWRQPLNWLWNLKGVVNLVRLINRHSVQAVISNTSATFLGGIAARITKKPHFWIVHELLHHPRPVVEFILGNKLLIKIISSLSAKVIVNSGVTGEAFPATTPVVILLNGLNWSRIDRETRSLGLPEFWNFLDQLIHQQDREPQQILSQLLPKRKEIQSGSRIRWQLSLQNQYLGVVGKLTREKGQDLAIYTLAHLKEEFPRLKLLLIGSPAEKSFFSYLKKLVQKLGLEERVVFMDYVQELYSLLPSLDILVVPSRQESFGRVVIEAMAVGVPVVAFGQGGLKEIIEDEHNGSLALEFSPEILAEKVRLLLQDELLATKFMIEGFVTVKSKYNLREQAKKLERLLEQWIVQKR
ncbi:MAG: hypothetical protein B5M54_08325 [Candidatus Aminicenantes bacterium 4484_214]|nr:glycosyltransferase family 4 protein [Candidatus Aminicenantes bacterium]OQX52729.1 MAG: hypothetical protein B5M54_08325 [Candidatus Aminicenantes bacterium 4484_214]